MLCSLGRAAGEEDLEWTEERGLCSAAAVNMAGHQARVGSDVKGCNQMNNEASGGMEFYFPVKDRAFHWVRQ